MLFDFSFLLQIFVVAYKEGFNKIAGNFVLFRLRRENREVKLKFLNSLWN